MRTAQRWWVGALAIVASVVVFLVPFVFIVLQAGKDATSASRLSFSWPEQPQFVQNFVDVLEARDYILVIALTLLYPALLTDPWVDSLITDREGRAEHRPGTATPTR